MYVFDVIMMIIEIESNKELSVFLMVYIDSAQSLLPAII